MFRDRIRQVFNDLPPSHQRLANFILDHYHQAAFMSTSEIGSELDLDAATVVRFAQRLDYTGYPDLRDSMREAIERDLNAPSTWSTAAPEDSSDLRALVMASLQSQIDNIKALQTVLIQKDVNEALEKILNARHIFVLGEGVSHRVADLFAYGLRAIGIRSCVVNLGFGDLLSNTVLMSPDDVLIAIACTAFCPGVINLVRLVREEGVSSLALTGARSWPLARIADIALIVPTPHPAIFTHYGAMTVLTKALLDAAASRRRDWLLEKAPDLQRVTEYLLQKDTEVDTELMPETISTYLHEDEEEQNYNEETSI